MKITGTTSNWIESPGPEEQSDCEANQEEEIQGFSRMASDIQDGQTRYAASKYERINKAS